MDKTVPAPAAKLLEYIGNIEAPRGYDTVFANRQLNGGMPRALTTMTVDEVIADGDRRTKQFKSSAAGRYQFMKATLSDLKKELGLRGTQVFTPDLQDRLGYHLLRRRGYDKWIAGQMTTGAFALNLAKEWASLPVLTDMKGPNSQLKRGQSYYAGDPLNKSLVKPHEFEAALASAYALRNSPLPPTVATVTPYPDSPAAVLPVSVPEHHPSVVEVSDKPKEFDMAAFTQAAAAKLRSMNPEQMAALFRTALQVLGGAGVSFGMMNESQATAWVSAGVTILVTAWGLWARNDTNLLASAAGVPTVKAVVVEDTSVSSRVPDPKVATPAEARRLGAV